VYLSDKGKFPLRKIIKSTVDLNPHVYSQCTLQLRFNDVSKSIVLQQNQQEFQMVVFTFCSKMCSCYTDDGVEYRGGNIGIAFLLLNKAKDATHVLNN
jgi:hypothetical protein